MSEICFFMVASSSFVSSFTITIISISKLIPNFFPRKYWKIWFSLLWKSSSKFAFNVSKKKVLKIWNNSCLILMEKLFASLSTNKIQDSSRESTCFFIAGNVRPSSDSKALIETPCLLKSRYLIISTFVFDPKSFSKFIYFSHKVNTYSSIKKQWKFKKKQKKSDNLRGRLSDFFFLFLLWIRIFLDKDFIFICENIRTYYVLFKECCPSNIGTLFLFNEM